MSEAKPFQGTSLPAETIVFVHQVMREGEGETYWYLELIEQLLLHYK